MLADGIISDNLFVFTHLTSFYCALHEDSEYCIADGSSCFQWRVHWNFGLWNLFLPARRYASAGTSYGPVPVSVTSRCSIETAERLELVLAWELSSTYPTLCYHDIQVPPKTITSGTLLLTVDLENFATTYRSSKRVINLAREGRRWECDKLDSRQSTKLTIPLSYDARPL